MDKAEFMRQWGVTGMPLDKIRLANAAWDAATLTEREACALIVCPVPHVEEERECSDIAEAIRMRSND
jgi:hypothetical protein